MSKLEQFIKDNQEAFDSYEPGARVWEAVEKKLPSGKNTATVIRKLWLKWSAVAAAVIIILATVFYWAPPDRNQQLADAALTKGVPPEYAEEVFHFTRLIEIKHNELKKVRVEQPDLYQRFTKDISRLDSSYLALKKELPDNPNRELLIQAMIQNLQWQIEVLNEQLAIIQKIKQYKKLNHEKYTST